MASPRKRHIGHRRLGRRPSNHVGGYWCPSKIEGRAHHSRNNWQARERQQADSVEARCGGREPAEHQAAARPSPRNAAPAMDSVHARGQHHELLHILSLLRLPGVRYFIDRDSDCGAKHPCFRGCEISHTSAGQTVTNHPRLTFSICPLRPGNTR